jgi:hypothetical protein
MRELPLVLKTLTENVKLLLKQPPLKWQPDHPSPEDLQTFQKEALQDSVFDPLKLRRNLWEGTDTGGGRILCKSCGIAKVLWIQPVGSSLEPDWSTWGRIFQWLGSSPDGHPWRVFWFPTNSKRTLPPKGEEAGPAHINGGYCYPCMPHTIVIYRFEESLRVLIHELLHASCTDPQGAPLPIKEATTETWAELFLVAFCSQGNEAKAKHYWSLQSQWIANQNEILRKDHHVLCIDNYAWRYTLGRKVILDDLQIPLPRPHVQKEKSSRLTHPSLCQ